MSSAKHRRKLNQKVRDKSPDGIRRIERWNTWGQYRWTKKWPNPRRPLWEVLDNINPPIQSRHVKEKQKTKNLPGAVQIGQEANGPSIAAPCGQKEESGPRQALEG